MRRASTRCVALPAVRTAALLAGALLLGPGAGQQAAAQAPTLTTADLDLIVTQAQTQAGKTASADGFRTNTVASRGPVVKRATKMWVAIVARNGSLLRVRPMADAWVGSADIAIAKARTAAFFSSDENALTSRIIGQASQAHNPDGTGGAGPLWGIGSSNQAGITGGPFERNGIITFPGGVPLYKGGVLVGGIGVSGDAVDQDEAVAFGGATGFAPGATVVKLGFTVPTVPAFP